MLLTRPLESIPCFGALALFCTAPALPLLPLVGPHQSTRDATPTRPAHARGEHRDTRENLFDAPPTLTLTSHVASSSRAMSERRSTRERKQVRQSLNENDLTLEASQKSDTHTHTHTRACVLRMGATSFSDLASRCMSHSSLPPCSTLVCCAVTTTLPRSMRRRRRRGESRAAVQLQQQMMRRRTAMMVHRSLASCALARPPPVRTWRWSMVGSELAVARRRRNSPRSTAPSCHRHSTRHSRTPSRRQLRSHTRCSRSTAMSASRLARRSP